MLSIVHYLLHDLSSSLPLPSLLAALYAAVIIGHVVLQGFMVVLTLKPLQILSPLLSHCLPGSLSLILQFSAQMLFSHPQKILIKYPKYLRYVYWKLYLALSTFFFLKFVTNLFIFLSEFSNNIYYRPLQYNNLHISIIYLTLLKSI